MRRLETYDWWPELVALKDELSLRELAEKFSVTPGAISAALKREGITRKPAPPGPRAHRKKKPRKARQAEEEPLPPEPGEVRAPPEGLPSPRPGSKDAQIHAHAELLGKVPDREVADLAGVSVRTIASFRSRHDIPAYSGPKRASAPRKRRSKIEPFEHLLGQSSDQEVADLAGVTVNAVRNYRAKRNIAAPASSRAASSGQQAWQVVIQRNERQVHRVVLAGSLVDAARIASDQGHLHEADRVISVTWVGEML